MYRNWKKFNSEGFVRLLKPCLKFHVSSSIEEAWDKCLRFEKILDSVLPLKVKTFTEHQCTFFDDKYRKSKTSVLKSEYEKVTNIYFEKFLAKCSLYNENALIKKTAADKFCYLKIAS